MDLAIIPECYVDTNLIETIVPPKGKGYNHQKGCGTVTKVMKEVFADSFALGIIDKDKNEVDYLKEFTEQINTGPLILHKHKTKHHYIIQINPGMETFIVNNAEAAEISLADHAIPTDFEKLKKDTKQQNSKKDYRFKQLFQSIMAAKTDDFKTLSAWVKYLRDYNYKVNMDELKKL